MFLKRIALKVFKSQLKAVRVPCNVKEWWSIQQNYCTRIFSKFLFEKRNIQLNQRPFSKQKFRKKSSKNVRTLLINRWLNFFYLYWCVSQLEVNFIFHWLLNCSKNRKSEAGNQLPMKITCTLDSLERPRFISFMARYKSPQIHLQFQLKYSALKDLQLFLWQLAHSFNNLHWIGQNQSSVH